MAQLNSIPHESAATPVGGTRRRSHFHLAGLVGSNVTVTLEIEAEVKSGAPDNVVRTVTENCRTLKFTSQGSRKSRVFERGQRPRCCHPPRRQAMTGIGIPTFDGYVGIDYSGAETPTSSLKGLRVYMADRGSPPVRCSRRRARASTGRGAGSPSGWSSGFPKTGRHWSASTTRSPFRCGISRPIACCPIGRPSSMTFNTIGRPMATTFTSILFAMASVGNGAARSGNTRWRRLTEDTGRGAKSVFHFDVPGSVAKSTHAGLPWLRYIRQQMGRSGPFLAIRRLGNSGRAVGDS